MSLKLMVTQMQRNKKAMKATQQVTMKQRVPTEMLLYSFFAERTQSTAFS